MIPRYTDVEQFFSVNSEDGMITTTRPLDREAQAWHNISVAAAEIGTNTPAYTHTGIIVNVCTMIHLLTSRHLSLDIMMKHLKSFQLYSSLCIFRSDCQVNIFRVVASSLLIGLVQ